MHMGVDYSTKKVAAALVDERGRLLAVESHEFKGKGYDSGFEFVVNEYRRLLYRWLLYYQVGSLALEAPIVGLSGNPQTAIRMSMVCGAMMLISNDHRLPVSLVPVSTWKKDVCGNGGFDKAHVAHWLYENHPGIRSLCSTDDEVDAVCIALYSRGRKDDGV